MVEILSFAKIKSGRYGTELQTMSVKLVDQRVIAEIHHQRDTTSRPDAIARSTLPKLSTLLTGKG